ncbi:MAG: hypothetical protein ACPKPY_06190 [Nitrososphaeraceae archaeon]
MIQKKTKIITMIIAIIPVTILIMFSGSDNNHAFAEQEARIVINNNLDQGLFFDQMKQQNLNIDIPPDSNFIIFPKSMAIINVNQENITKKIELTLEFYIVENESNKLNKIGLKKSDTLFDSTCFSSAFGNIQINYECEESTKTFTFSEK